jgi:hypothetical protein
VFYVEHALGLEDQIFGEGGGRDGYLLETGQIELAEVGMIEKACENVGRAFERRAPLVVNGLDCRECVGYVAGKDDRVAVCDRGNQAYA